MKYIKTFESLNIDKEIKEIEERYKSNSLKYITYLSDIGKVYDSNIRKAGDKYYISHKISMDDDVTSAEILDSLIRTIDSLEHEFNAEVYIEILHVVNGEQMGGEVIKSYDGELDKEGVIYFLHSGYSDIFISIH